ncbi:FMN-dependent dehydrogenase [Penicillium riverlandense]|uniref:FMN-dependent dehydrogenase n=1 Tax=Penicillium riverlandense TaxID=1903569 RepID=UPI0025466540|nr:FMN-dependent dehydrogenase [Penicillium riverlandense]KAJ5819449.1 FMN-dependent dehydrogenase [Penicillium riverlandense]
MAGRFQAFDAKIFSIEDLKNESIKRLDKSYSDYYNGASMDLLTLHDNEFAFDRYKLRPRCLMNVSKIDTSTEFLGSKISFPFGFSPAAYHVMAHPDGEIGTSRGAAAHGVPMVLSSYSSLPMQDVIKEGKGNPYGINILFHKDRGITRMMLQKAEAAGYKAAFVTVDCPVLGIRLNEYRNSFMPPTGMSSPNLKRPDGSEFPPEDVDYDDSVLWVEGMKFLRENTKMQIWTKGVTSPEDVEMAIKCGVDGIVISNHGGRQLDGMPATLDVLRQVAPIAKGRIQIGIDGGFRRGSDIFKAIALGADICFSGRVPIWGLAYNGSKGVDLALRILRREFEVTMALCGCQTLADISRSRLGLLLNDGNLARL